MNARGLLAAFLLTLALGVGLTACSGDNDPSAEPPTTAPPEPADTRPTPAPETEFPPAFVKKVERICVQTQRSIDDLSPIEDEASLREAVVVYEGTTRKLRELKPPERTAEAFDRFVEVYADGARSLNGIFAEVGRGDSSAFQRVTQVIDTVNTESSDAAQDYGFKKCQS